ncbi:hypothetical protein C9374_002945 [Naegleria lovaniensis]|uniref:Uncharacterized protein n=1 Tax=Naegleria lovaniensis TaxID=51637 RepID=A0AA88KLX3_NAELO|nr:uncharacterized protein C9374_002945 [Naegleria lovaniensis]KAG2385796.1 hypothetical protein C9374_002945 [Naegleria lovaniensis]
MLQRPAGFSSTITPNARDELQNTTLNEGSSSSNSERCIQLQNSNHENAAKKENVAVVLDTGTGKTMIALLLTHYMLFPEKKATTDNSLIVFIAENKILVTQQFNFITNGLKQLQKMDLFNSTENLDMSKQIDSDVDEMCSCYVGGESGLLPKIISQKLLQKKRFIATTAQFLHNMLSHNALKMEQISLLIIDECHHCGEGDHPYKSIMSQFYRPLREELRPKIFGMTASAINCKGNVTEKAIQQKLELEYSLDCKLTTIMSGTDLYNELLEHTNLPEESVILYKHNIDIDSDFVEKFEDFLLHTIKRIVSRKEIMNADDLEGILQKLSVDVLYLYHELGAWAIEEYFNLLFENIEYSTVSPPISIEQQDEHKAMSDAYENFKFLHGKAVVEASSSRHLELQVDKSLKKEIMQSLHTFLQGTETFMESSKTTRLMELLQQNYWSDDGEIFNDWVRGLVFCERRIATVLLSKYCSRNLGLNCDFIVGHNADTGKKSLGLKGAATPSKQQNKIESFRKGLVNCLFCTNVVEEGFDVPACNLVIRFDPFNDYLRAYIQSRGRARKKGSKFIIMIDAEDEKQRIFCSKRKEVHTQMQQLICADHSEERQNFVPTQIPSTEYVTPTGAKATLTSSIQIVNRYYSLRSGSYYEKKPNFEVYEYGGEYITDLPFLITVQYNHVQLLITRYCALKAVKLLHQYKELDDNLFPYDPNQENISIPQQEPVPYDKTKQKSKVPKALDGSNVSTLGSQLEIFLYDILMDDVDTNFQFILPKRIDNEVEDLLRIEIKGSRKVVLQYSTSRVVDAEWVRKSFEHHDFMFRKLSKLSRSNATDEYENSVRQWSFFVLPKNMEEHFTNVPLLDLIKKKRNDNETWIKDMVLETSYNHKIYLANRVRYDLNPNATFSAPEFSSYKDFCEKRWNLVLKDLNQPLVEAYQPKFSSLGRNHTEVHSDSTVMLVPEFVNACSFSVEMMSFIRNIPEILYNLRHRLLTIELSKTLDFYEPLRQLKDVDKTLDGLNLLQEAITAKRTNLKVNYEKLEFYGDTILKYVTCKKLFFSFPDLMPGALSRLKQQLVSNEYLANAFISSNLEKFILTEPLSHGLIVNNLTPFSENSFEDWEEMRNQDMKKKVLADVVESIIGFCYLQFEDMSYVERFLDRIGFRFPDKNNVEYFEAIPSSTKKDVLEKLFKITEREVLSKVEWQISYIFNDKKLLLEALIHASYHSKVNYERFEFLGDAILDMIITKRIIHEFYVKPKNDHSIIPPDLPSMNELRERIIKNQSFTAIANSLRLFDYIIFSGEDITHNILTFITSNDQENVMVKILSDAVESIAAAIYLDNDHCLESVEVVFDTFWEPFLNAEFEKTRIKARQSVQILSALSSEFENTIESSEITLFLMKNMNRDPSIVLNEVLQKYIWLKYPNDGSNLIFQETTIRPEPPTKLDANFIITFIGHSFMGTDRNLKSAKKKAAAATLLFIKDKSNKLYELIDDYIRIHQEIPKTDHDLHQ